MDEPGIHVIYSAGLWASRQSGVGALPQAGNHETFDNGHSRKYGWAGSVYRFRSVVSRHQSELALMDMLQPIETLAPAPAGFDYAAMPEDVAERQRERAAKIARIYRKTVEAAGAIGRELLAAQAELEHGLFLRWVEGANGMSKSSAYRFMDMARSFGDKLPTVGSLPMTVIHKLSEKSTPEPVRAAVLRRFEAGETVAADQIMDEVREAKIKARANASKEREEARRAALSLEARAKEDAQNKRKGRAKEAREAEIERERKQRQEHADRQAQRGTEAAMAFIGRFGPTDGLAFLRKFTRANWHEPAETACLIMLARLCEPTEVAIKEIWVPGYGYGTPKFTREAIEQAAQEMTDGPDQPVVITLVNTDDHPKHWGRYKIVEGEVRLLAARDILNRSSVSAQIAPSPASDPEHN